MNKGAMIKFTSELQIGEWVHMEEDNRIYKGWVSQIKDSTIFSMFCIGCYDEKEKFYTVNKVYKNIATVSWNYKIFKEVESTFKDVEIKSDLYNIALDTGDEDWLRELAN